MNREKILALVDEIPIIYSDIQTMKSDLAFFPDTYYISESEQFRKWRVSILFQFETIHPMKIVTQITNLLNQLDNCVEMCVFDELKANLQFIAENIDNFAPTENNFNSQKIAENEKNSGNLKASNKVFIVHGHNETVQQKSARFLEKLGFEPIILHEQASNGNTIIEKIEEYTNNVCFAVVLYTDCDEGKSKKDTELQPRARQNVVFEHGYLIAKLGRARVVALVQDGVETPGDMSGVVYIKLDPNDGWRLKVATEMKAAGVPVDMNKLT